jgi:hypothetical protein
MIVKTSIASRFRSHKTFAIGLVTALLIIALAVKSSYSVGSCQKQASIRIVDETGGKDYKIRHTWIRTDARVDSPFYNYVNDISKHFFLKIDEIEKCKGDVSSDPQIELVFVYRPLISYQIEPFNFDLKKSNDIKYLDSPWVKLTIARSPKLIVRAAFIWNERQFLFDQALLSGARASPNVTLLPIDRSNYVKFLGDYSDKWGRTLSASKKVQAAVRADLANRLPADLMWLYSGSFYSEFTPEWAMDRAIERRAEQYTDLTKELLNYRFGSLQTEQRYDTVLDLKNVFKIDNYQLGRFPLSRVYSR